MLNNKIFTNKIYKTYFKYNSTKSDASFSISWLCKCINRYIIENVIQIWMITRIIRSLINLSNNIDNSRLGYMDNIDNIIWLKKESIN